MRIIGRRAETEELKRCEKSAKSELVCLYGRRRVGKTYLVERTYAGYFAFRATGLESGNTRQQLKSFNMRLQEYGDTVKTIPRDWFEAFSRLNAILSKDSAQRSPHGKLIVFLDEFPWFATPRSDFLAAFGEFWNRCGTAQGDYLFVICGSATSWIIGNVLENTGSLYNRVTRQIHLVPFTLAETERFLNDRGFGWSRRQIAECYMVFGGLPYFLDLLDADESLGSNIDRLLFAPYALLRHESKKLLEATLKKSPAYGEILAYLAPRRHGIAKQRCFEELSISKGTFTRAVDDLVKCGYVAQFKKRGINGGTLQLQLVDAFLLFHYTFLARADGTQEYCWQDFVHSTGVYNDWRGTAFELLCLSHVDMIKGALGVAGVKTTSYPWSSSRVKGGAQVDLVIERADGITNICEAKFTDKPFAISEEYERKLLNKCDVFREETEAKDALKIIMVASEGIAGTAHTEHVTQVLTLDDLFE